MFLDYSAEQTGKWRYGCFLRRCVCSNGSCSVAAILWAQYDLVPNVSDQTCSVTHRYLSLPYPSTEPSKGMLLCPYPTDSGSVGLLYACGLISSGGAVRGYHVCQLWRLLCLNRCTGESLPFSLSPWSFSWTPDSKEELALKCRIWLMVHITTEQDNTSVFPLCLLVFHQH